MNSAAQATAWQIWRPSRWLFAAELAYLLLAAAVSWLLPAIVSRTPLGASEVPLAAQYLCFPIVLIVTHWLGAFALARADGKHFGFPSHMFVLPVRTRALVVWPVLYGCAVLGCLWWFVAWLILRPLGIAAPLWWPAATLAALLTMLQALSWTPFAQNWLRLVLAGPVLGLLGGILLLVVIEIPEVVLTGILLAVAGFSVAISVWAVSVGRRGDSIDWRLAGRVLERCTTCRSTSRRPFASADAAQIWLEWHGHGWALPLFVGCVLLWPALALVWHIGNVPFYWRMLGAMLALPLLIGALVGNTLGRQDAWSKFEMTSFLATRPMTTAAMIRAKLVMAALSTAAAWLVVLPFLSLMLLEPSFFASVREVAQAIGFGKTLAIALCVVAAGLAGTWLLLVQNLWLGLMGREWLVNAAIVMVVAILLCGAAIGFWIYLHPAWHPAVQAAIPSLVVTLLLAKLILGIAVVTSLARARLVATPPLAAMVGLWSVVVAGLCLAVVWLVPSEHLALGSAAAGIALFVPFSRLAAAPLALSWNRHR